MATQQPLEASITEDLPVPAVCADCGTPVGSRYCPNCGQETRIETPTVRHFLEEFVDQFIALEGKLGRTLRVLLTRPGQLTLDYVEGRRQRYVRPLKLYLTASVIFFALLGVLPDSSSPFTVKDPEAGGKLVIIDAPAKPAAVSKPGEPAGVDEAPPAPGSFEAKIQSKVAGFSKLSAEQQRRAVREKLANDAPYAMFFLLPYFALLLKWFYRKQKLRYGVHLLFSLHVHSFVFIALGFGFLPLPSLLRRALEAGVAAYMFVALRRVYGGTPMRTAWRIVWLWLFYIVVVGASAASDVLAVLFSGGVV